MRADRESILVSFFSALNSLRSILYIGLSKGRPFGIMIPAYLQSFYPQVPLRDKCNKIKQKTLV